ncbi:hypothetical protein L6164_030229 [Bauhinia variegata]|uniref:Uncharacterized protein n=1 Tax=Bauhinia variegata TaxID=167791 RepID=A0ACB9LBQ4_BAUVA|nr:hypothetical protein L6164_030229 [Bauhinia variegata]
MEITLSNSASCPRHMACLGIFLFLWQRELAAEEFPLEIPIQVNSKHQSSSTTNKKIHGKTRNLHINKHKTFFHEYSYTFYRIDIWKPFSREKENENIHRCQTRV